MTIPVDLGIPITKINRSKAGRPPKYPINQLKVGESFFTDSDIKTQSMSSLIDRRKRTHKWKRKFIVRTVDNGIRVWRVE